MSSHLDVYIGVYLVVDQYIEEEEESRECKNGHGCGHAEAFCPQCGTPVGMVSHTETRRMSAQDAAEEFDFDYDEFNTVDRGDNPPIWVENGSSFDAEKCVEYEINPDTITIAVNAFKRDHWKTLGILDKNNVDYKMHYGAVSYYD